MQRNHAPAATIPKGCLWHNHPEKACVCSAGAIKHYMNKISGPMLDRIDLHIEVTPVSFDKLTTDDLRPSDSSATIRARV